MFEGRQPQPVGRKALPNPLLGSVDWIIFGSLSTPAQCVSNVPIWNTGSGAAQVAGSGDYPGASSGPGRAELFHADPRRSPRSVRAKRAPPRSGKSADMNQLATVDNEEFDEAPAEKWELKKLKPVHLQICALLAQGFKNVEVAGMTGVTKEYITMLLRMPIIKQEIAARGEVLNARFELMTEMTADAMVDTLKNGSHADKMKAARLQLEVTKRIGRPDPYAVNQNPAEDRLAQLANRLEGLLDGKKGGLYDEAGQPIFEEAEVVWESQRGQPHSASVQDGNRSEA
jgi:hypothetical protein